MHLRFNSLVCTYLKERISIWITSSTYDSIPMQGERFDIKKMCGKNTAELLTVDVGDLSTEFR